MGRVALCFPMQYLRKIFPSEATGRLWSQNPGLDGKVLAGSLISSLTFTRATFVDGDPLQVFDKNAWVPLTPKTMTALKSSLVTFWPFGVSE